MSYRSDEAHVEKVVFGKSRQALKLSDVLSWYELYIALMIAGIFVVHVLAWIWVVRPLIGVD